MAAVSFLFLVQLESHFLFKTSLCLMMQLAKDEALLAHLRLGLEESEWWSDEYAESESFLCTWGQESGLDQGRLRNIVEIRNPATLMRILRMLCLLCLLDRFLTSLARATSGL